MPNEHKFENMDSPVTASQFLELHKDIKEVKRDVDVLLHGNEKFGVSSIVEHQQWTERRFNEQDEQIDMLKTNFDQFKTKVVAYSTAGVTIATIVVQAIFNYL